MLLSSSEFREQLRFSVQQASHEVIIVSGFVTAAAVRWLGQLAPRASNVTIVARWRIGDLRSGASDFEAFVEAEKHGFRFCVDPDLHTKVFLFDRRRIYVGSANFTSNGLWLDGRGNLEMVTAFEPEVGDVDRVAGVVNQSTKITPELFELMASFIETEPISSDKWPNDIAARLYKPVEGLWVADFPFCGPGELLKGAKENAYGAYGLMGAFCGARCELKAEVIAEEFRASKAMRWLRHLVQTSGDLRFGALSAAMHGVLLDDPVPYRSDVKKMVASIFEWVEFIDDPSLRIIPHRHTKSIRWCVT